MIKSKREDLSDITVKTFAFMESADVQGEVLFRSREQIRHKACDFELRGRRYENYSVSVLAYNDFGHYYLHAATPNNDDTNP